MAEKRSYLSDESHAAPHNRVMQDHRFVDMNDPNERAYWVKYFDVRADQIVAAVSAVGNSAQKVQMWVNALRDSEKDQRE